MAIMIPEKPIYFDKASLEDVMFDSLAMLPDEYYVFHSLKLLTENNGVLQESETDFVIFNKKKGIICIEAKAGQVKYSNGYWVYGNGERMKNGGPFNQADTNKWKIKKYIENSNYQYLLTKCKLLHAVWFPSITEDNIYNISLPPEADKKIILTMEALQNPEPFIKSIYNLEIPKKIKTNLDESDVKNLIQFILCPAFSVFPSITLDLDVKRMVFHRLLKEQSNVLNFLTEQRSAAINGAAGTGKTMIAIEKAKMHASIGEKVLFLCYNSQLKNFLATNYNHDNIFYYTIDGLACMLCQSAVPNYSKLKSILEDTYLSDSFKYNHVIIDEGQDFGQDFIEESDIIQLLSDIIIDNSENGNFYVFYDKLQMIQNRALPKYISEADCKLTLYKNCRNTENIAITSLRPITDRKPKLFDGCVKGKPTIMYFCDNETVLLKQLYDIIMQLNERGITDIVILTCKTEESSIITKYSNNGYLNNIKFTTCRKFKGLEADAVILIDVDKDTFNKDNALLFYVGSSRARINLDILSTIDTDDSKFVLEKYFNKNEKLKRAQRELASSLNALCKMVIYEDNSNESVDESGVVYEKFKRFLEENPSFKSGKVLSTSSSIKYADAINKISEEMIANNIINENLFSVQDTDVLNNMIIKILNNKDFIIKNKRGDYMYSNALEHYQYFNHHNNIAYNS